MKATKAEILKRVEAILEIRLAGAEFTDIRKYAAENGWNVSDSQLWRYIRKTDEILAHSLERDREKLLNRHLAQRFALYARAMSVSDYRTALAVLKDQAELCDLYPAPTQKLTQQVQLTAALDEGTTRIIESVLAAIQPYSEAREAVARQLRLAAEDLRARARLTNGDTTNGAVARRSELA
ncbi:MAG TPA: hypothetical protein VKU02_22465 [Gemmataceae bacterium]|nr:hypothetical protein [Gemmataceae bacterium]